MAFKRPTVRSRSAPPTYETQRTAGSHWGRTPTGGRLVFLDQWEGAVIIGNTPAGNPRRAPVCGCTRSRKRPLQQTVRR